MCAFNKKEHGEDSPAYADALYLRAKVTYSSGNTEEALGLVRKSLRIELNKSLTGTPKDLNRGMMFLLKATI